MAQTSRKQRRTTGRVMHEFKHGELKRGPEGKGGKVKSRRQAIAIAMKEAGASKYESKAENRKNLAKTKRKEARGETAQQEREGKTHVGARGKPASSPAMRRRRSSDRGTAQGRKTSRSSAKRRNEPTKAQLYKRAQKKDIQGRSKMSKQELKKALG